PLPQALPRPQPLPATRTRSATGDLTDIEASLAQAAALPCEAGCRVVNEIDRGNNQLMAEQRWALIRSDDGTEDFRLFTSVGEPALTLWGDMAFVGLWRRTWREPGEEILEERALDADELAELLQRADVDSTEAAEI